MKKIIFNSTFIFFIFIFFIGIGISSFNKEITSKTLALCTLNFKLSKSIHGLWVGSYAVDGQPNLGNQYLSLIIKPDGTMINDSKAGGVEHLAIGTWILIGDSAFSSKATAVFGEESNIGITQTHKAKFNKKTGILTIGKWYNNNGISGSGTFKLKKIR